MVPTASGSIDTAAAGTGVRDDGVDDQSRIARQAAPSTDGGPGHDAAEGYTGTLEHGAFGTGFETYADPRMKLATDVLEVRAGIQGEASGGVPTGSARWSGLMLGYRHDHATGDDPFVQGRASLQLSLPESELDVAFTEVASLDSRHRLDDFGFEDTPLQADGTFASGGGSGDLRGVLLGLAQEEAAGTFHHDAERVTGSFGAVRLPDPPPPEGGAFTATRAPSVDLDGTRHVGAGVAPEDLSPESLGPWSDTFFHLRGDMTLADGQAAAFGVALRKSREALGARIAARSAARPACAHSRRVARCSRALRAPPRPVG